MNKFFRHFLPLVLLVVLVAGAVRLAPFFMDPRFEVINASTQPVSVTASWRSKHRELGPIQPASSYSFTVDDEAAMKFTGQYPDGQEVVSTEIYFTAGSGVVATITEQAIEVRYDFEK